jgi:predicted metalloendopeptidase
MDEADIEAKGLAPLRPALTRIAALAAAHDAWRAALPGAPTPRIGGLDGEQQFFVGFAQTWQTKDREPALRQQLLTDGHAPARFILSRSVEALGFRDMCFRAICASQIARRANSARRSLTLRRPPCERSRASPSTVPHHRGSLT